MTTTDTFLDQKSNETKSRVRDYFNKGDIRANCTAGCFGLDPIKQECYYCKKCDPKQLIKLCTSCFDECHKECQSYIPEFDKANFKLETSEFACECFIKLKHHPNETQRKKHFKCELKVLDKFLHPSKYFYCSTEKLLLCSFCYFVCHEKCETRLLNQQEINSNYHIKNSQICQCRHVNHSSFNEFLFEMSIHDYCKETNISFWPVQLINFTFSIDSIFNRFTILFKQHGFTPDEFKEMIKSSLPLLFDVCYLMNRKFKSYYFNEKVKKIFSYETLTFLSKKCSYLDNNHISFKLALFHLLLYVHFKRDFSFVNKALSSSDFLSGDVIQRLIYRKKTGNFFKRFSQDCSDENLIAFVEKYGTDFKLVIDLLFNDLFPFVTNLIQRPNISIIEFNDQINTFLKIILFLLKKNIFSLERLKDLIDNLNTIHGRIIFIADMKNEEFLRSWLVLFNSFAEIFFLIAVKFNDLIVEKILNNEPLAEDEERKFIHADLVHGPKLLRMIMKSNYLVCRHYKLQNDNKQRQSQILDAKMIANLKKAEKKKQVANPNILGIKPVAKGFLSFKILTFYNESVKLFALANNTYISRLKKITQEDIDYYLKFSEKQSLTEEAETLLQTFNCTGLKNSIENKLNFLFINYSSSEQTKLIANSIKIAINDFINENTKEETFGNLSVLNSSSNIIKSSENGSSFSNNNTSGRTNSKIEEKYHIYAQKVIDFNKYTNTQFIKFVNKNISLLQTQMINSNIDETIAKILVIFSDSKSKILTFDYMEYMLSFLSMFFVSKRTMQHFITGKNLLYLNKLFHRYCITKSNCLNYNTKYLQNVRFLLEFYQLILQGIIIYDLDLSNSKFLQRLKKNLIDFHINEFYSLQRIDKEFQKEFKAQLNITMKIFYTISNFYDFDEFGIIKCRLLQIITDVLDKESFYRYYKREVKGLNDSNRIRTKRNTFSHNQNSQQNIRNIIKSRHNLERVDSTPILEKIDIDLIFSFFEIFAKKTYCISERLEGMLETVNSFFDYKTSFFNKDQGVMGLNTLGKTIRINEADNSSEGDEQDMRLVSKENESVCESSDASIEKENTNPRFQNISSSSSLSSNEEIQKKMSKTISEKDSMILFLFENDNFELNEKVILLSYLRTVCFIEWAKFHNVKDIKNTLSTQDYINFITHSSDKIAYKYPSVSAENYQPKKSRPQSELEIQFKKIQRIILLIRLYINELQKLDELNTTKSSVEQYLKRKYLAELVFGIKTVADFFYLETKIWNKPILFFYALTIEFIPKVNTMIQILNKDKEIHIDKKKISEIIGYLTCKNFDIFNIKLIYKYLCECIEVIYEKTKINSKNSLKKFLEIYDVSQENDFIPDSLIEDKDYEYFYENEEDEDDEDSPSPSNNNSLVTKYINEFIEIQQTALLMTIKGISNDMAKINYRKKFVDYFKAYINSLSTNSGTFESHLCIITKIFYYDTSQMKELLINLIVKTFFSNFQRMLQRNIFQTFITCKNYFITTRALQIINLSKLTLQFLQLLGEDFCTDFQSIIFKKRIAEGEPTIFQDVISLLQMCFVLLDYKCEMDCELPYDKLIIMITNSIDFIIEYLVTKKDFSQLVEKYIDILLFQNPKMIEILRTRIKMKNPFSVRIKVLLYCKVKIIQLVKAYISSGQKTVTLKKINLNHFSTLEIFDEIIYTFRLLLKKLEVANPKIYTKLMKTEDINTFVKILLELYSKDITFRDTLELKLCFYMFILIKIIEERYHHKEVFDNFDNFEKKMDKLNPHKKEWNIHTYNGYKVYMFFNELVLNIEVEVNVINNEDQKEEEIVMTVESEPKDALVEGKNKDEGGPVQITKSQSVFFIRPYLSFFISKQSCRNFVNNVDRESAIGKYTGLMKETDYFLFDMVVNKKFQMSTKLNKFFCDVNFYIFECISFMLVVGQNIILILSTYKSYDHDVFTYDTSEAKDFETYTTPHLTVSIIQVIFIVFVIAIYIRYKLILNYQRNLMIFHNKNFVFRQKKNFGQKKITNELINFFQDDEHSLWQTLDQLNKEIPLKDKVKILVVDSILLNREICTMVYTLIFVILYLILKVELLLIVPTFFICNLSSSLFAIYSAIIKRWDSMGLVLAFTYLVTYIFMWFAYFFLYKNFVFYDVINPKTNELIKEQYCSSTIQCWLYNIDYGVRPQFGGGDMLRRISFRDNAGFYVGRWIYDTLFHIFIVLILRNLFLGIIVEAFAELRNRNYLIENDIKNICFICQITRDQCLYKSIDFKEHVEKKHNMWNYVYFLMHLHLGNSNDLDQVQKNVWDKIGLQDYTWIPQVVDSEESG